MRVNITTNTIQRKRKLTPSFNFSL